MLTYNIRDGGADRLPRVLSLIRDLAPHVVALQEANEREGAEWLARALGMQLVFGAANGLYHVAWLSREPVVASTNHRRPVFSKTVLEIELSWAGQPLRLFATHLASRHDGGEARRAAEVEAIVDLQRERGDRPHLLVGDFNALHPEDMLTLDPALPDDVAERAVREYQAPRLALRPLLAAGYTDCYRALRPTQPGYTYRSDAPVARIDYIFAAPQMAGWPRACDVVTGPHAASASDHRAVWVDLL